MKHIATVFSAETFPVNQYVIIRDNCETFVAWAENKEDALKTFHDAGYQDEWKVLLKRKYTDVRLAQRNY